MEIQVTCNFNRYDESKCSDYLEVWNFTHPAWKRKVFSAPNFFLACQLSVRLSSLLQWKINILVEKSASSALKLNYFSAEKL